MEMVKSQMLSLRYILYDVDDDESMTFVYNDFGCECYFENGLYVGSEFEGLNAEVGQNIDNNYKKSCTSLFVIDKDDDYWEFFETKDGKTYISISYDPSGYYRSPLIYVSKYSPAGKEFYENVKNHFEEMNDKNNPDTVPDAEISPLKIEVSDITGAIEFQQPQQAAKKVAKPIFSLDVKGHVFNRK